MTKPPEVRPDICVIGADQAGIEIAFAAAGLGVPVMLVTAREVHAGNDVAPSSPPLSPFLQKLRAVGVGVIEGRGSFTDPHCLAVGNLAIRARRYVIATGATARMPDVQGIELPPVWDEATELPPSAHLLVVGGGALGVAQAQAARRLGVRVTLLSEGKILDTFDPEMADMLRVVLEREEIAVREHVALETGTITPEGGGLFTIAFVESPGPVSFTHLMPDCGLIPLIGDLGLEKADISTADGNLVLSASLRTSNRRIYAAGSVAGGQEAQHHARAQSGTVLSEILFRKSTSLDPDLMCRLALTHPAIAEIGLQEREIKPGQTSRFRFYRISLAETSGHRAWKKEPAGQIKVITSPNGLIRGVSILAEDASELIVPFTLAMTKGVPLQALAQLPIATPSHAEAIGALGRQALAARLRTPGSRRLMRFLRLFG